MQETVQELKLCCEKVCSAKALMYNCSTYKLDTKSRTLILRLLVEGNSIRATTRIADV